MANHLVDYVIGLDSSPSFRWGDDTNTYGEGILYFRWNDNGAML